MRNVKTICICLPAEMAEHIRAEAQRLGLSVSSYVKLQLIDEYGRHKNRLVEPYGMVAETVYADTDSAEVMDDGSED